MLAPNSERNDLLDETPMAQLKRAHDALQRELRACKEREKDFDWYAYDVPKPEPDSWMLENITGVVDAAWRLESAKLKLETRLYF